MIINLNITLANKFAKIDGGAEASIIQPFCILNFIERLLYKIKPVHKEQDDPLVFLNGGTK